MKNRLRKELEAMLELRTGDSFTADNVHTLVNGIFAADEGGGFVYVEYDSNAFPHPQTIGSTANSISGLGNADESMINTIFIMPNKETDPTATMMIVVDEVDPPTNPKTYQYVYVGNINDLPSDVLTEGSIVDIPGTDSESVMSQKGATDLVSEYNVSANNNNTEYTFAQAVALVPASLQKGGLTIKYIDSTTHEYAIKRLMSSTWNTTESNWQGIDDEPTAESNNLVESGGVFNYTKNLLVPSDVPLVPLSTMNGYIINSGGNIVASASRFKVDIYEVTTGDWFYVKSNLTSANTILYALYNNVTTDSYHLVELGGSSSAARDKNIFLVKAKNNTIRIAVQRDSGFEAQLCTAILKPLGEIQEIIPELSDNLWEIVSLIPDWQANHDYVVGNQCKVIVEGVTMYYRCETAHTSGESFETTNWRDLNSGTYGAQFRLQDNALQKLQIKLNDNAIYQSVIHIDRWDRGQRVRAYPSIGKWCYLYDKGIVVHQAATVDPMFDIVVPYSPSMLFEYQNELYSWNGSELISIYKKLSDVVDVLSNEVQDIQDKLIGYSTEELTPLSTINGKYILSDGNLGELNVYSIDLYDLTSLTGKVRIKATSVGLTSAFPSYAFYNSTDLSSSTLVELSTYYIKDSYDILLHIPEGATVLALAQEYSSASIHAESTAYDAQPYNKFEEVTNSFIEYAISNSGNIIDFGHPFGDKKIGIKFGQGGSNNLADFRKFYTYTGNVVMPSNVTNIISSVGDMHAPFIFRTDGGTTPPATSYYFTGGNHDYDSGATKTAKSNYIRFFIDGGLKTDGNGYCRSIAIEWQNDVKPGNAYASTDDYALRETHRLVYDGVKFEEWIDLEPLVNITMGLWYGLQMMGISGISSVQFAGATNRQKYGVSADAVSGDKVCSKVITENSSVRLSMYIDNSFDTGKRSMSGTADRGAFFITSTKKSYFTIIRSDNFAQAMNANTHWWLHGGYVIEAK